MDLGYKNTKILNLKLINTTIQLIGLENKMNEKFLEIDEKLVCLNKTVSWIIQNTGMRLPPPYPFNPPYIPPIG